MDLISNVFGTLAFTFMLYRFPGHLHILAQFTNLQRLTIVEVDAQNQALLHQVSYDVIVDVAQMETSSITLAVYSLGW